jgi:hypothetical protein
MSQESEGAVLPSADGLNSFVLHLVPFKGIDSQDLTDLTLPH